MLLFLCIRNKSLKQRFYLSMQNNSLLFSQMPMVKQRPFKSMCFVLTKPQPAIFLSLGTNTSTLCVWTDWLVQSDKHLLYEFSDLMFGTNPSFKRLLFNFSILTRRLSKQRFFINSFRLITRPNMV